MRKTATRFALGAAVATLLLAPSAAIAAGGALQTISNGGKELAAGAERHMPSDWVLDQTVHGRLCDEVGGGMDEMDCSPLVGGLDHAAAGTGLRNTGYGTASLRGVPAGVKPVLARLMWGRILDRNDPPDSDKNIHLEFDGTLIKGRLLGTTESPCWDEAHTFAAYGAAVPLSLLRPTLNGDYVISLDGSVVTDGGDLFNTGRSAPLDEGATLLLVYSDPDLPRSSRVYLHAGAELLLGKDLNLDHALDPALPANFDFFRHTRIGGDGQRRVPEDLVLPYATWIGSKQDLTPLRGPESKIDTTTDWNGDDSTPKNWMWDTQSHAWERSLTPALGPGSISYRVLYQPLFPPHPDHQEPPGFGSRPTAAVGETPLTYWVDCVVVVGHVLTAG